MTNEEQTIEEFLADLIIELLLEIEEKNNDQ